MVNYDPTWYFSHPDYLNQYVNMEMTSCTVSTHYRKGEYRHERGRCNGKCYYCHLENMTIGTKIWKWLVNA